MSITLRQDPDSNAWIRELIGRLWRNTPAASLNAELADIVLEGCTGLEHDQVEARLKDIRRRHDAFPGVSKIRENLMGLRRATEAVEASMVGRDAREAAIRLLQGKDSLVGVLPGEPEASEHTRYWLERAGRLLLHRATMATDSIDDVHRWHGQAVPAPRPVLHDPHFTRGVQHPHPATRFLLGAANVCRWLGWERVGWDRWYAGKQLFQPFDWTVNGKAEQTPASAKSVRFYQHGDLRRLDEHKGSIDFGAIIDAATERRRVLAIADRKGI
ncbi:MAG: hypothetical protein ACIAQU_04190 [Phycisphaerales bacterium JB064]